VPAIGTSIAPHPLRNTGANAVTTRKLLHSLSTPASPVATGAANPHGRANPTARSTPASSRLPARSFTAEFSILTDYH